MIINFASKKKERVALLCSNKDCQDEECNTATNSITDLSTFPMNDAPPNEILIENGRDLLIWLNGFAEGFSQFAAIYPLACFFDWGAQLIDPKNTEWKAHGFTEEAEFSPNAFYLGLGVSVFLMLGSAYCHSEMQRLNQLKRKNKPSENASSEPLSLSGVKMFLIVCDVIAHWLGKIGMPIIMVNLYINDLISRYSLFTSISLLGAIATIAEAFACYFTLLEIQAIETGRTLTAATSDNFWSLHAGKFNAFSFVVQCCVSYLDNLLVFQQMTGFLLVGMILAVVPTFSEATGQYILNTNKSKSNEHICASSNCSVGFQKTTSWTDFFERTTSEKILLGGRTISLANGCIEAGLLLTLLFWKNTSSSQKTLLSLGFFVSGMPLCVADLRNIATEIKNYIVLKKQASLFGLSIFDDYCCKISSNKGMNEKLLPR